MKKNLPHFALVALLAGLVPVSAETILEHEHVDLNASYTLATSSWALTVRNNDVDPAAVTSGATTLLYVDPSAQRTQPGGSKFAFIGAGAGQAFYQLPQAQNPDLLYLGFAAYGVNPIDFDRYNPAVESGGRASGLGRWLRITLTGVRGPGEFSVWQDDEEGPNVFMATADGGITAQDSLWILAGGHLHFNWGFTQTGIYEIDFRLSGYANDGNTSSLGTLIQSPGVFTTRFGVAVVPEPRGVELLLVALALGMGLMIGRFRRFSRGRLPGFLVVLLGLGMAPLRAGLSPGYAEIDNVHADIAMPYIDGSWQAFVHTGNSNYDGSYAPDLALLTVNAGAQTTRPAGSRFDFLGVAEGAPIWSLSASQVPGQLYLGVEADYGFSSGRMASSNATNWKSWDPDGSGPAVSGRYVMLNVVAVRGPGYFSLYDFGGFGSVQVRVASADGLGPQDGAPQLVRSHSHYNWVFTEPGRYEIDFQARSFLGPNSGPGTEILSPVTTFYFNVVAVPEPALGALIVAGLLGGLGGFRFLTRTHRPTGETQKQTTTKT